MQMQMQLPQATSEQRELKFKSRAKQRQAFSLIGFPLNEFVVVVVVVVDGQNFLGLKAKLCLELNNTSFVVN